MTYATICSGIGTPEYAINKLGLGWRQLFCAEIDTFPSAVLKHHYPDVPNYGDMTQYKEWPDHNVDVIIAGTPCQAFSVAGLRKSLNDPRGNLTLVFLGIIEKYQPKFVVWENVPGILSAKDHPLKAFLTGLRELGYEYDIDILNAADSRVKIVEHLFPTVVASYGTGGGNTPLVQKKVKVRRLTPEECEALQGFLAGYTRIPYRKKLAEHCPDGPRYKALGNAMAAPVIGYVLYLINAYWRLYNDSKNKQRL
jgi:site-specific DNA-cytosine methylase